MAILGSFRDMKLQRIVIESLRDLISCSWSKAFEMIIRNFLWPFRQLGALGLLFGLVYWPVVMPFCILAGACYVVPLFYISIRLLSHALELPEEECEEDEEDQSLPGNNIYLHCV